LDLSKNVSEPAKSDLGNSPSSFDTVSVPYAIKRAKRLGKLRQHLPNRL